MFRTCISGITQAIASASKHIHTSAVLEAAKKTGARNKKVNLHKTGRRAKAAAKNRPSVILGTRPKEEEKKWKNCALAKILINEDLLSAPEPREFAVGKVNVPEQLGFGVDTGERDMLLNSLPILTADMAQRGEFNKDANNAYSNSLKTQLHKANMFAKVLDLRNANASGISYVNRRRIIFAFSTPQNPFNTGRTEVQAALLTYKIRNVWKHLKISKSDTGNRRNLRLLVHERARILRYLKKKSRDRYEILLERLSLEPESVEGELVI